MPTRELWTCEEVADFVRELRGEREPQWFDADQMAAWLADGRDVFDVIFLHSLGYLPPAERIDGDLYFSVVDVIVWEAEGKRQIALAADWEKEARERKERMVREGTWDGLDVPEQVTS